MALSIAKNKNIPAKKKDLEEIVEEQRLQIEKLQRDKIELEILTAEMVEQAIADKLEMQTAMAELAEALLMSMKN